MIKKVYAIPLFLLAPLFLIAQEAEETDSFSEDVIIVSASKIDESLSKTTEVL